MAEFVEIGKIVNTHGLKGEIKVLPWCDDISVFSDTPFIYIDGREYKVIYAKIHKNIFLVKFEGIDTIEKAELLKQKICSVTAGDMPQLPDDVYYVNDLLGAAVYTEDKLLGELVECFPTGSNDVYVVRRPEGRDILLPAIKQVVKKIDTVNKRIDVELMEGLLEL